VEDFLKTLKGAAVARIERCSPADLLAVTGKGALLGGDDLSWNVFKTERESFAVTLAEQ
jgi:hypothetical protein